MTATAVLLTLSLVGQSIPPELRVAQPRTIDPALPSMLRVAVEQASSAELDAKRGPGNAVELLKAARDQQTDVPLKLQLDLRIAGVLLRARFSQDPKQPPTTRVARALSTYSRLDLTEPGLGEWIKRAVAASAPATQARFAAKDGRRLRLAVTAQGAGVDAEAFSRELTRVYGTLGVQVVKTAAKDADYVAKLAALDVRDEGGRTAVRVTMDLAAARGEEPRWRTTLFRTSLAANPKDALAASVDWLVRIGGRDLLFAWLDAQGLEGVKMQAPAGDGHGHHDHDGHDHGGSGRVPITGGAAPPRIQLDPGGRQPSPPPPAPAPR
jgi:hypothetical protein